MSDDIVKDVACGEAEDGRIITQCIVHHRDDDFDPLDIKNKTNRIDIIFCNHNLYSSYENVCIIAITDKDLIEAMGIHDGKVMLIIYEYDYFYHDLTNSRTYLLRDGILTENSFNASDLNHLTIIQDIFNDIELANVELTGA